MNLNLKSLYIIGLVFFGLGIVCHNAYLKGYKNGMMDAAPPIILPVNNNQYAVFMGLNDIDPSKVPEEFNVFMKKKEGMTIHFPLYDLKSIGRKK